MTPAYPSRATLAIELDCSESTIDDMVRRGVLPRPIRLSTGCVRFCWADVEMALQSRKDGAAETAGESQTGVRNAREAPEGRRHAS
jgi:predicted DNA-binding transcriptional regulator AlpA